MIGFFILSIPFFLQKLHKLLPDASTRYHSLPEAKNNLLQLENKNKNEQHEENKSNIWCELDTNLLGEIMSRLCLTGQARFRCVCKKWLAARPITPTKSLPWCVYFDLSIPAVSKMLEFRLCDLSLAPNLASVYNISLTTLGIPSPSSYKDVRASLMHGWLFISIRRPRLFFWSRRYFLLFSLYTKEFITLPKLDYPCRFRFMRAFSTKPDSPNCVFFLFDTCHADKIAVITYRNGDKEWTAREFDRVNEFVPCCCYPVYIGGILYIVSPYGQLASYNIVNDEFRFESLFVDEVFRVNFRLSRLCKVFEFNGKLMLIYFGPYNKINTTNSLGQQCIKMYDWSNKVWIPVSTLGDNALFVSETSLRVATINREAVTNNRVLSNKIYLFFKGCCLIYSIHDGELVELKYINSNFMEDGGGNLPEYKYSLVFSFLDATKAIFWSDPPCARY